MLLSHVVPVTANLYTIYFYSHGLNVGSFGVQGFIISQSLINNPTKKNILLTNYYVYPGPTGYFSAPIFSYTGVTITTNNVFFGLNYFWSLTGHYDMQLNVSNSQVLLFKGASTGWMSVHILVFLRNHCDDPFSYD